MSQLPSAAQLGQLLTEILGLSSADKRLLVLCDLPTAQSPDNRNWRWLRWLAGHITRLIAQPESGLNLAQVMLLLYNNVGSNNADLPTEMLGLTAANIGNDFIPEKPLGEKFLLPDLLDRQALVIGLPHYSATAPLKILAREHLFRGITIIGFCAKALPLLYIDHLRVKHRVEAFKQILDEAEGLEVIFQAAEKRYGAHFDLRHRTATASSGFQLQPGQVGNFPSGETYIVPYEGEREGDQSRTAGTLPVQFADEIVLFELANNRAQKVLSTGAESDRQGRMLELEPAYGNIAEVGLGLLAEFGIQPIGTGLDEKLGLHIAFGRSDHFGGICGADSFTDPKNVVHIDYIYVPSIQPKIEIAEADLIDGAGKRSPLMRAGKYTI